MSGFLPSTGILTNEGNNFLDIQNDLDKNIDYIVVHNIPLQNPFLIAMKTAGKLFTPFIHSALTPTFSHIAIQLNIDNSDFFYIIEYGQYYSRDSTIQNTSFNSRSSNEPRKSTNKHDYYYINVDGTRLTRISKMKIVEELLKDPTFNFFWAFTKIETNKKFKTQLYKGIDNIIAYEIAKGFYGEIKDKNLFNKLSNKFKRVNCKIRNKITLRELCNNFQNEKWLAKNYSVVTHNCQTFAAEVVKILMAIREDDEDKIRLNEKELLPNCIIEALRQNENRPWINTIGRIPIFGFFWDIGWKIRYAW